MSKTQKDKLPLPKGGIFFQGETVIKGDYVEHKEVHGNEIHGNQNVGRDNISINGDGNIIGNRNTSKVTKMDSDNDKLESYFIYLSKKVDSVNRLSSKDKQFIASTLQQLQGEIKKGDDANPEKVTLWLKTLKKAVPEIIGGLLEILIHPLVGKMVEVVAKAVLKD